MRSPSAYMKNGGKLFGVNSMTNTLAKDGIQNVPLPLITRYFRRTKIHHSERKRYVAQAKINRWFLLGPTAKFHGRWTVVRFLLEENVLSPCCQREKQEE